MPSSPYEAEARDIADRLPAGNQRTLHNPELRVIFGVSRITAAQRDEISRALEHAGLEVISGATTQPLVIRNPTAEGSRRAARTDERPWFERKRTWAIAVLLFILLGAALGSGDPDSDESASSPVGETATQTTPAAATQTTPTPTSPTRAELEDMVDADRYADALSAAARLGDGDESYIGRRIANRLARRTMYALSTGDRSRARFLVTKADAYPSTTLSLDASTAYEAAQARASARAAARRAEAQRILAEQAAREEAERVADEMPDIPDQSVPDSPSGPSSTNWCGKRDGDGDGIYCEGE